MSDNAAQETTSQDEAAPGGASPPGFSLGRTLIFAVPLAAVVIAVGAYYLVFEGAFNPFAPAAYEVSGVVVWNGQPAAGGEVTVRSASGSTSIGFIDEKGNFTLQMQKDGRWVDGAQAGDYKVKIAAVDDQLDDIGMPANMSPAKYASYDSSGLTLTVNGNKSDVKFELSGDGRVPPVGGPGGNVPMDGVGGPGPPGGGGGGPPAGGGRPGGGGRPPLDDSPDGDPDASDPEAGDEPKAEPKAGDEPKAEPKASDEPKAEPKAGDEPKAEPKAGDEPKAEPKAGDEPKAEPKAGDEPKKGEAAGDAPKGKADEPKKDAGEAKEDTPEADGSGV